MSFTKVCLVWHKARNMGDSERTELSSYCWQVEFTNPQNTGSSSLKKQSLSLSNNLLFENKLEVDFVFCASLRRLHKLPNLADLCLNSRILDTSGKFPVSKFLIPQFFSFFFISQQLPLQNMYFAFFSFGLQVLSIQSDYSSRVYQMMQSDWMLNGMHCG